MTYVLDACALIALFKQEEGFEKVRDLIKTADDGESVVYLSIINALEIYYGFIGADGIDYADGLMRKIYNSSITIIDIISKPVFNYAAKLKGAYRRLSLADAVGLATAADFSACFVTSDHKELEPIEQGESIPFFWFR
jgi:predicted nucleic acid-binding protein